MREHHVREIAYIIGVLEGITTSLEARIEIKDKEIINYCEKLAQMKTLLRELVGSYVPLDTEPNAAD